MADEFAKGLGILTASGLAWMVVAGWYFTPAFESNAQLITPSFPAQMTVWDRIGIFLADVFLWFAILGALTFWVVVPLVEEAREAWAERSS